MFVPSRGAWVFRNVTKGFTFTPLLDTISIEEVHPDGLSTFTCDVQPAPGQTYENEDRCWVKFDGEKIWAGHLKTRTRKFFDPSHKLWSLFGQDYTSKLDDSVITTRGRRPRESAADRVDFILEHLNFAITTDGVDLPDEMVEPWEPENTSVREALQVVADELVLHFYIDFGPDDGGPPDLHMFRTETFDAPFDLDGTDPDYSTRFPFSEFEVKDDSQDYKNAVRVRGDRIRRWVTNPTEIDDKGRQETPVTDSTLLTLAQVRRAGQRVLDQNDLPEVHGELVMHEPGLRAGMRFGLRLDAWSLDTHYIATQVAITAVDPKDAEGTAMLFSSVTFTDKRRVRRMPGGGRPNDGPSRDPGAGDGREPPATGGQHEGTGGGHGGCGCPVDLTELVLDDFERTDVALTPGIFQSGVLGSLPVPTDTRAWWGGDNDWKSFFTALLGGAGIEDGAFYVESHASHHTSGNTLTLGLLGSEHLDGPFPDLPFENEEWEIIVAWSLSGASGNVGDAGERYLFFDWMFGGGIKLNFGDGVNADGIQAIGQSVDTATMALPFAVPALLRMKWQDGSVWGKVWAAADDEPAAYQVSTPLSASIVSTDLEFNIAARLGNASGPVQRVEIAGIHVVVPAQSGELVEKRIPHGSGGVIDVGEAYEPGTLSVRVDDQSVSPDSEDPGAGTADLGGALYHDASDHPGGCARVVVTYRKA